MRQFRLLVTSLGTATATAAVKILRRHSPDFCGFIVGTDINEKGHLAGAHFCDAFEQVPRYDDLRYIEAMRDICVRYDIQYILPIHDCELEVLARYRSHMSSVVLCSSSEETIRACNDKLVTGKFLSANGIACPPAWAVELGCLPSYRLPLFVKPRYGVGSRGCFTVEVESDWPFVLRRVNDPIAQPVLEGDQYVLDVLNDLNGKNLVVVPRREFVSKAGVGTNVRIERDALLMNYGASVAEVLGVRGPANIEVFVKDGCINLIEVNPRLSAGHVFSALVGVNLPFLTLRVFSGEADFSSDLQWRSGLKANRYWEEAIHHDIP